MTKITDLPAANSIDPVNDMLAIVTNSLNATQKISRNVYLGLSSAPVGLTDSQTLTNKALTSPSISNPVLSGILTGTYTLGGTPTFPSSVATLTGSQTLTNKVLTSPTINTPTITNASITADNVSGFTTSNNGTIYGISVTGGAIGSAALAANAVTTAAINNAAVTANKISLGAATSTILTTETTTSTTYTDLATPGPSVTVTIGANGLALVFPSCGLFNSTTSYNVVGLSASGANTIANTQVITVQGTNEMQFANALLLTGLTPGSTTFKMQYEVVSGTGTFKNRRLTVVPL